MSTFPWFVRGVETINILHQYDKGFRIGTGLYLIYLPQIWYSFLGNIGYINVRFLYMSYIHMGPNLLVCR